VNELRTVTPLFSLANIAHLLILKRLFPVY
jgi:hypothetical protein